LIKHKDRGGESKRKGTRLESKRQNARGTPKEVPRIGVAEREEAIGRGKTTTVIKGVSKKAEPPPPQSLTPGAEDDRIDEKKSIGQSSQNHYLGGNHFSRAESDE